jgi:hypothetical protein
MFSEEIRLAAVRGLCCLRLLALRRDFLGLTSQPDASHPFGGLLKRLSG